MADLPDYISSTRAGILVHALVQPKAATTELVGIHGPALKIKVRAVPEREKANDAVCRLIARILGIAAGRCTVVAGEASRHKKVAIEGMDAATVAAAVESLLDRRGGR